MLAGDVGSLTNVVSIFALLLVRIFCFECCRL